MTKNISVSERFWQKVNIGEPDECWEWLAGTFNSGYGKFRLDGKSRLAHRVAFEAAAGTLGPDLDVLHKCDNPLCVNPAHLFVGNQLDNARDMTHKGRGAIGDKNGRRTHPRPHKATLSPEQVAEIRRLWALGDYSQVALAAMFGINRVTVCNIVNNKLWRHI